jgi:hypothetical protein
MNKNNGNGIDMKTNSTKNLLQKKYYKEIFFKEFVNLLTTTNTTSPID